MTQTQTQIIAALKQPIPPDHLATRQQGGTDLTYVPWHKVISILDFVAPGWQWEITSLTTTTDRIFLVGRLTIPTAEGSLYREATGTELLKDQKVDRDTGEIQIKELAFGDPSSNAESMAFRRAAAKFGLGLYLYQKPAQSKPRRSGVGSKRPAGWEPAQLRPRPIPHVVDGLSID